MRSLVLLGLVSAAGALSIAPLRPSHARVSPRLSMIAGAPIEPLADVAAAQPLLDTSMLLAKSDLIQDVMINVPLFVTGCLLATFGGQYIKNVKPLETDLGELPVPAVDIELPELDDTVSLLLIPAFAVAFVLLAQTGAL